jgi:dTDP-L-rhamnose 4-epimerase
LLRLGTTEAKVAAVEHNRDNDRINEEGHVKALVTGGAGLIGSHIVDLLIQKGHQAVILDNLAKPTHLKGRPDWINPQAEFILGDVRSREDLRRALEGVDWVFHQAADGGFTNAISHYFSNNSLPTAVLYELLRERRDGPRPVQKVVTASSQAVYGEGKYACAEHGPVYPEPRPVEQMRRGEWEMACPVCQRPMAGVPIDESQVNPLTPYALSKYMNELLALNLGKLYGIPTAALRYSLTYGPRQSLFNPYTGITSIFSTRILSGKPPVIYEDGRQTRDFIFVEDVARANLLAAENEAADYQAFNVGTGVATSVLDFVELLAQTYQREAPAALRGEFRPGDFRHLSADASKLRKLGWAPQTPLAEGLRRYATWIQGYGTVEEYFSEAERLLKETQVIMQRQGRPREGAPAN